MSGEWHWKEQSLHEFIPTVWFKDPSDSSGWLRIYSSVGLGHNEFRKCLEAVFTEIEQCPFGVSQPVSMSYGQLAGFETSELLWSYLAEEDGLTQTTITLREGILPRGNYVVLVLPFRVDGHPGDRSVVQTAMDQSVAALIVHMGRNLLRDLVYEGEVNAAGLDRKPQLGIVPVPQAADGPFLNSDRWSDFCAAMHRLNQTRPPKRDRIKLSLEYLHSALTHDGSFFEYWVALEILCKGPAGTISERIKECNGFSSVQGVKERTGFEVLKKWRHDFFHEGQRPRLTPPVERYLQLLYLDLLRHELSLPPRGRMLAYQDNGGCDLSPLGLADGRKSESDCGALPGHVSTTAE